MEPSSSWLLTITKRYRLLLHTDIVYGALVLLLCVAFHGYVGENIGLSFHSGHIFAVVKHSDWDLWAHPSPHGRIYGR